MGKQSSTQHRPIRDVKQDTPATKPERYACLLQSCVLGLSLLALGKASVAYFQRALLCLKNVCTHSNLGGKGVYVSLHRGSIFMCVDLCQIIMDLNQTLRKMSWSSCLVLPKLLSRGQQSCDIAYNIRKKVPFFKLLILQLQ